MNFSEVDGTFRDVSPEMLTDPVFRSGLVHKVSINGIDEIPGQGSFVIFANHPATIDPILALDIRQKRQDAKIIVRKQNSARFPNINILQNRCRREMDVFLFNDEFRGMIQTIRAGGGLLICPTGTLDRDVNRINPSGSILPQTYKIAARVNHVLVCRINLRKPVRDFVEYEEGILQVRKTTAQDLPHQWDWLYGVD